MKSDCYICGLKTTDVEGFSGFSTFKQATPSLSFGSKGEASGV
ncbi:MAG: hypothetical protein V7L12_18750 [Nostoc sp.]